MFCSYVFFSSILSVEDVSETQPRTSTTTNEEYLYKHSSITANPLLLAFCYAPYSTVRNGTKLCLVCINHRFYAPLKLSREAWTGWGTRAEPFNIKALSLENIWRNTGYDFGKAVLSSFQNTSCGTLLSISCRVLLLEVEKYAVFIGCLKRSFEKVRFWRWTSLTHISI